MTRLCADCYGCLSWADRCAKGILSVPGGRCYGLNPIPEPEPCELEQGILFVEVDKL